MKIVHVLTYSYDNGGVSKVVFDLAKSQMQDGNNVTIISIDLPGHKTYHKISGVEIIHFQSSFLARFFPLFSVELFRFFSKKDQDVYHLHGFWNFTLLASYILGLASKTLVSVHGCANPYTFNGNFLKRTLFSFAFQKAFLKNAKAIHVFHENEKQYVIDYLKKNPKNIFIVPNGIDFKDEVSLKNFRFNSRKVLFMSRLDPIKGLDLLLPAFLEVNKVVPEAKLLLAGPDFGMLDFVKEFITKNNAENAIEYLGVATGETKQKLMDEANIFVLPSYSEGFSIAVLEALKLGIPVVVSQFTGLSADILEYNAGIVVNHNVGEITSGILEILRNPEKAKLYAKNGQALVKERFEEKLVQKKMAQLYSIFI